MKQILISGVQADIPKLPIAINWEYMDLAAPGKKYSPFTSTLTLPFTAKNKGIMGFGDVPGADLTKVRSIPYVDLIIGATKFIKDGTLKILSSNKEGYQGTITGRNIYIEAIEAYTLDMAITDAAATFTYATYANAIAALRTGEITAVNKGFILPRTLEGAITSSTWTLYSTSNGHTHEVWISAYTLLKAIIDEGVMTLKIWEEDAFVALEDSALYDYLCKLYMPCWNWVLYDGASWTIEEASGQRLINGNVVNRSIFTTFGGRSSWDFIKYLAQLFCCIIYQEETEISFIPLNQITSTGAIDLTGRAKLEKKYFAIPDHGSSNYISYKNTDNLNESFGRVTITSPVVPLIEKSLLTLELMLPGQLWVNLYSRSYFNTDYNSNGSLKDNPMLLYDGGDTNDTTLTHGTDTVIDIPLKALTYLNLARWWAKYHVVSRLGEVYDADIYIDPYVFTRLRPWLLVRANELGGLFYVNKITGFDPDSGRAAKCQLIKWSPIYYSLSPISLLFTYRNETKTITVTSNVAWTASALNTGVTIDKTSGTGDDTVTVTANADVEINTTVRFVFAGINDDVTTAMTEMTLVSVDALGTHIADDLFVPPPTIVITSDTPGTRRVFWAIYKAAVLIDSGYSDFPILNGTNDYSFTGLYAPSTAGTDYTFRVGYRSGTYPVTSSNFTVITGL